MPRGVREARLFNLNTLLKNIFFKTEEQKNKRIKEQKGFSAIEICASLVKLRDNELSGYVPR